MDRSTPEPGKMEPMPDSDTLPQVPADVPPHAPAGPTEPVDIGGWPTWLRRTVTVVVLGAALALAAWGMGVVETGGGQDELDPAIVSLFPTSDAQALRQTEVGAELAQGYDGRLTVNGIEVPEAQMEGARDPSTVDPADLAKNGLRPNNRNHVFFKPGPGKVLEELQQGTVTITLRYFKDRKEETSRTVSWSIRVD